MAPNPYVFLLGAAWLSMLTVLLLYVASTLAALHQAHAELLARLKAADGPSYGACPACECRCPVGPTNRRLPDEAAGRPEYVQPVLRWLGMDIGRDFFRHLTTWSRGPRARHALVVEVGAGDGRQAAETAKLGYRVISIDASRSNLDLAERLFPSLVSNASAAGGNLTRVWAAVANYTGEAKFWAMSGMGRLLDAKDKAAVTHADNPKWAGHAETVPVRRLDDLVAEVPWLLKIDVEGHELGVLQGARRLLEGRPKVIILEFNPVMMEWSARSDAYQVLAMLHELGYDLYDGQITEPAKKGFVAKYGSTNRPRGFRDLVAYFRRSKEFDWWGAWTDVLAIQPDA